MGLLALTAWGCNSDNVSWTFISTPTGSGIGNSGGAVLVLRYDRNGTGAGRVTTPPPGGPWLATDGRRGSTPARVLLHTAGEVALVVEPDAVELRCTLLGESPLRIERGRIAASPAGSSASALSIATDDAFAVDPSASGIGRFEIGAQGTVIALEHAGGVLAWTRTGRLVFGPGSTLRTTGPRLAVVTPDGRQEDLLPRPAPPLEDRLRRPAAGRLELLGPRGRTIARLPEAAIELSPGPVGVFLRAEFASGLGEDPQPFGLVAATANRYLLRLEF